MPVRGNHRPLHQLERDRTAESLGEIHGPRRRCILRGSRWLLRGSICRLRRRFRVRYRHKGRPRRAPRLELHCRDDFSRVSGGDARFNQILDGQERQRVLVDLFAREDRTHALLEAEAVEQHDNFVVLLRLVDGRLGDGLLDRRRVDGGYRSSAAAFPPPLFLFFLGRGGGRLGRFLGSEELRGGLISSFRLGLNRRLGRRLRLVVVRRGRALGLCSRGLFALGRFPLCQLAPALLRLFPLGPQLLLFLLLPRLRLPRREFPLRGLGARGGVREGKAVSRLAAQPVRFGRLRLGFCGHGLGLGPGAGLGLGAAEAVGHLDDAARP
mmetsp:Transcript_25431/g.71435  ORF Transcript_25431/g.71435 Transcript_25431/m.71435 type:complete len:325 (-) Transcript_25431:457-1431(-)